jgi:hypothetical protein
MGYQAALDKSWNALETAGLCGIEAVRFFTEEFRVDARHRVVLSVSGQPPAQSEAPGRPCGQPAKDFVAVLILHYLKQRLAGLPQLTGSWISFKELDGGESYYPAFRKRSIDGVLKKYGANVEGIFSVLGKMPSARKIEQGDAAVVVEAFTAVPLQVIVWKGDEEFAAEATILFDRSISGIFNTEDIAVLAGFVTKYV